MTTSDKDDTLFALNSPLPMKKTCCHCQKQLPLPDFQRDSTKKDGHRSTCKTCTSISRRKQEPIHIPIIAEDLIYKRISEKHQACFNLTVQKDGKTFLHIMSTPSITIKGSIDEIPALLEKAVA